MSAELIQKHSTKALWLQRAALKDVCAYVEEHDDTLARCLRVRALLANPANGLPLSANEALMYSHIVAGHTATTAAGVMRISPDYGRDLTGSAARKLGVDGTAGLRKHFFHRIAEAVGI